jgi:hypothetical protein
VPPAVGIEQHAKLNTLAAGLALEFGADVAVSLEHAEALADVA